MTARIPFVEELQRRNQQSRDAWELYSGHRAHIGTLLHEAAAGLPRPRRLAALGAGNCNDLVIADQLEDYDEIHLVDLDAEALSEGVARQSVPASSRSRVKVHGRMDVTGCLNQLAADLGPDTATDERIDAWIERIRKLPSFPQPSPFHVVASLGMLTQLSEIALLLLGGPKHPRGNELLLALRNHHLRKLLEMTRPGGIAILLTEVVSSFTFPNLPILGEHELAAALYQQVALKNFFTGANPYALEALVRKDPQLQPRVAGVEMLAPWRWNQGSRIALVSGLRIRVAS